MQDSKLMDDEERELYLARLEAIISEAYGYMTMMAPSTISDERWDRLLDRMADHVI